MLNKLKNMKLGPLLAILIALNGAAWGVQEATAPVAESPQSEAVQVPAVPDESPTPPPVVLPSPASTPAQPRGSEWLQWFLDNWAAIFTILTSIPVIVAKWETLFKKKTEEASVE